METIVENAQLLVYSLLALMPSPYRKAALLNQGMNANFAHIQKLV